MSVKVTCGKCGARLVYNGTATTVRPCPKCQMPIAFIRPQPDPAPLSPALPIAEEPVAAEAVAETKPQPKAAPAAPASPSGRRSAVIVLALGGLAAAFGGLMVLVLACGGLAVFLLSGDRQESLASGTKGEPFSTVSDVGYTGSSYSPSPAIDYAAVPSASGSATDEATAADAQAEKARAEEEQRRYAEEYWAQRDAEAAADRKEAEEAHERYQEAFRETFRIREAYP